MNLKKSAVALGTSLTVAAGQAFAAIPAEVTAAITEGTADGKTLAYALLAFAVVIGVVLYIKRKAG